jgi:hypothetical protein
MILAAGIQVWGCGNKEDAKPATSAPPPPTATTTATAVATATAAAPKPPPPAEGRTPRPTLEEWRSLKKEVTVKGSSALKCETKILREYLRIACTGEVEEGTPRHIQVKKGGAEALVYAHGGMMSLIVPYVEGTALEAVFSWTKKSHKLMVTWPRGQKTQPPIVGVFEGAASPLDGTAKGDAAKLCDCYKKQFHENTCQNLIGAADADCDRTYASDCAGLIACAAGDARYLPRCLPGFVNGPGLGRCFKLCGAGREACPKGWSCARPDIPGYTEMLCLDD